LDSTLTILVQNTPIKAFFRNLIFPKYACFHHTMNNIIYIFNIWAIFGQYNFHMIGQRNLQPFLQNNFSFWKHFLRLSFKILQITLIPFIKPSIVCLILLLPLPRNNYPSPTHLDVKIPYASFLSSLLISRLRLYFLSVTSLHHYCSIFLLYHKILPFTPPMFKLLFLLFTLPSRTWYEYFLQVCSFLQYPLSTI
jgi:hypothetical protein